MTKISVRIVEKRNPNSTKNIENQHMSGEKLARTKIAPFISHLTKKYRISKVELASALISTAYSLLRKDNPPTVANSMFRRLASKSQKLVDFKRHNNIQWASPKVLI